MHFNLIAKNLNIPSSQVRSTLQLLEDGKTIPFIARYRKEVTGGLDEVDIASIKQEQTRLDELVRRKATIIKSIEEQGKMTEELNKKIEQCFDSYELEDLYLPYKQKRKTRASIAKEKGLEPLAEIIFKQEERNIHQIVPRFFNENVLTEQDALDGAKDIIAEWINENDLVRNKVRNHFKNSAVIFSKVIKSKESSALKYKDYFDYKELLSKCPSHRLLAMRRGEDEGLLRLIIEPEMESVIIDLQNLLLKPNSTTITLVNEALTDSYNRLIFPSIETEFRKSSKELADNEAIKVFVDNLQQLLLAAPLGQKRIMGIDPGFRTGCKVVCIDESGQMLNYSTIFPHPPQNARSESIFALKDLVADYKIQAIAIGNGTAGRETEQFVKSINFDTKIDLYNVDESGASIYSASEVAREEFPDHDVTVRGAVSIARRLMDPLAELVKIDAKSIGVGQYQHDVNQIALKESLDRTVEFCVNKVGVNLNTASKHLLTYISGIGPIIAQNIVSYRNQNGFFTSKEDLKKVPRLGDKAFEQCAGFLRIRNAIHPLDNTGVHPETYEIVEKMANDLGVNVIDLILNKDLRKNIKLSKYVTKDIGMPTLMDINKELEKPGLDPRGEAASFSFADHVHSMEDLSVGMILPGIVTNITNFGCFVDIGVKQDGLIHLSQLANKFIKHPSEVVKLKQFINVKVMEIDIPRKRITLSAKDAK